MDRNNYGDQKWRPLLGSCTREGVYTAKAGIIVFRRNNSFQIARD